MKKKLFAIFLTLILAVSCETARFSQAYLAAKAALLGQATYASQIADLSVVAEGQISEKQYFYRLTFENPVTVLSEFRALGVDHAELNAETSTRYPSIGIDNEPICLDPNGAENAYRGTYLTLKVDYPIGYFLIYLNYIKEQRVYFHYLLISVAIL